MVTIKPTKIAPGESHPFLNIAEVHFYSNRARVFAGQTCTSTSNLDLNHDGPEACDEDIATICRSSSNDQNPMLSISFPATAIDEIVVVTPPDSDSYCPSCMDYAVVTAYDGSGFVWNATMIPSTSSNLHTFQLPASESHKMVDWSI